MELAAYCRPHLEHSQARKNQFCPKTKTMIKKTLLVLLGLLVLSIIGGYFYFDNKFTPPENSLQLSGTGEVDIQWVGSAKVPYQAMLLPVQVNGFSETYYLQLDYGAPNTMLFTVPLKELDSLTRSEGKPDFSSLHLGDMKMERAGFYLKEYGNSIKDNQYPIIGTLGSDILEKRVVEMDFEKGHFRFTLESPQADWTTLSFDKRKLIFHAKINERDLKLLFDSGTSAYQWITDKGNWEEARVPDGPVREDKANSWGRTLYVYTAPAKGLVQMGDVGIPLQEVTYVEGYSMTQELLMRFSGMEGMIGNKFFLGKTLVLDVKNQRYSLK